jgi:hypothetical protein
VASIFQSRAQDREKAVCPESTIESANRRSFIRKAAAVTAAVGVGGILLEGTKSVLPESSADSANSNVTTDTACSNVIGQLAVFDGKTVITGSDRRKAVKLFAENLDPHCVLLSIANKGRTGGGLAVYNCYVGNAITAYSGTPCPCELCWTVNIISQRGCAITAFTGSKSPFNSAIRGVAPAVGCCCCGSCAAGVTGFSGGGIGVKGTSQYGPGISGWSCNPTAGVLANGGKGNDKTSQLELVNGCSTPISWHAGVVGSGNKSRPTRGQFFFEESCSTKLVINTCGRVGIGTISPNTTLQVNGGVSVGTKSESSDYSMSSSDFVILAKAASKAVTITLPPASNTGQMVNIKKVDSSANSVTIQRHGTDTIEGAASKALNSQYAGLSLVAGGDGVWYVVSSSS